MQLWAIIVFLTAGAACFYCVLGYPLLLAALASWRTKPVKTDTKLRSVSVLIAVYNGAGFITDKLDSVLASDYPAELLDVVVVSDASTDETDELVAGYASRGVQLIRVPRGGKPAALNVGIKHCTGEILVLTDVRQRLDRDSIRELVGCFGDASVAVAIGQLLIEDSETREKETVGMYWRYESWIRKNLSRFDSMLGATGPFYAMRRALFQEVPPETLLDDMYLPLTAFLRGYRLVLNDNAKAYDVAMDVATEFRRKVRTLAGNYQLMWLLPAVITFKNRMWLHYLSYKVSRLLLPFFLLALFVASFFLPGPWGVIAVAGQTALYLLALIDPWIPAGNLLKRLSNPSRVLGSFLLAAVYALKIFFVPPKDLWKPTQADRRKAN